MQYILLSLLKLPNTVRISHFKLSGCIKKIIQDSSSVMGIPLYSSLDKPWGLPLPAYTVHFEKYAS